MKKQIAELKIELGKRAAEIDRLTDLLDANDRELVRLARDMFQVRQLLKSNPGKPTPIPVETDTVTTPPVAGPKPKEIAGPENHIAGEVRSVDKKEGVLLINRGVQDDVKVGYRFEILRTKNGKTTRIAVAEVVKFLGTNQNYAKCRVIEGQSEQIKVYDAAVAIRKPSAVKIPDPDLKTAHPKFQFQVTGTAGKSHVLNCGAIHGVKLGDRVFVFRRGKQLATLRIDVVKRDWSAAAVIQKEATVKPGDEIRLKATKRSLVGRVALNDPERGIMVDFGSRAGAKSGMVCEVRRGVEKVGRLVLTNVYKWHSYANPEGDTKRENFRVKDFVEVNP